MNRRSFLAVGASLAAACTAGCTGAPGYRTRLSMVPVSDAEIARWVTSDPFPAAGDASDDWRRLVESALSGETPTVRGTSPPFPSTAPFVADGAVYTLDYTVVESTPATSFPVTLRPVDGAADDAESIAVEELPEVDRQQLSAKGLRSDAASFLGSTLSFLYPDTSISESAIVPEPTYPVLVWPETDARIEVGEGTATPIRTYRYSTSLVAESAAAYGRQFRADYEFQLSDLSSGEREIVETALRQTSVEQSDDEVSLDGGYISGEDEALSSALRSLFDRFETARGIGQSPDARGIPGTYLAVYDGQVYWTVLAISGRAVTPTEQ